MQCPTSRAPDLRETRRLRSGAIVTRAREHVLRTDVSCRVAGCQAAACRASPTTSASYIAAAPAPACVLVVDVPVLLAYLDLLELPCIRNVVFPQSVLDAALTATPASLASRVRRRVRNVSVDARVHHIVFPNDHVEATYVRRGDHESVREHQVRQVLRLCQWYTQHVAPSVAVAVLTDDPVLLLHRDHASVVLSPQQYLQRYLPDEQAAADLEQSLRAATTVSRPKDPAVLPLHHASSDVLRAAVKSGALASGVYSVGRGRAARVCLARADKLVVPLSEAARDAARAVHGDTVAVDVEAGRVVGVIERNWREYAASVADSTIDGASVWLAVPVDPRVPKVRVRLPNGAARLRGQRFVIRIDDWPVDASLPSGHFVRVLGPIADIASESAALLVENQVADSVFAPAMTESLPGYDWSVDEDEDLSRRRDLRTSHRVFSIDPKGAQDIDDALSIRRLPGKAKRFQLGVHIADVSHFLRQDSLLDAEARARGTTVYLVDRRIDMLPAVLSECLCSLRGGQDRFAFSVLWDIEVDSSTQRVVIHDTWFGKTIIRSCAELQYEQCDALLAGRSNDPVLAGVPELLRRHGVSCDDILLDLQMLGCVSDALRAARRKAGALELEGMEVRVELDAALRPVRIVPKAELAVHHYVSELMILANTSVARRILRDIPHATLLRRHGRPDAHQLTQVMEQIALVAPGARLDVSSNAGVAASLSKVDVSATGGDPLPDTILRTAATRAMAEAEYMASGAVSSAEISHYGLALDVYTHFTSPIRRYADVCVHRLLWHLVDTDSPDVPSPQATAQLASTAEHLNQRNRASKAAQRQSTSIFQALYFHRLSDPRQRIATAVIAGIRSDGIDLILPEYRVIESVSLIRPGKGALILHHTRNDASAFVASSRGRSVAAVLLTPSSCLDAVHWHKKQQQQHQSGEDDADDAMLPGLRECDVAGVSVDAASLLLQTSATSCSIVSQSDQTVLSTLSLFDRLQVYVYPSMRSSRFPSLRLVPFALAATTTAVPRHRPRGASVRDAAPRSHLNALVQESRAASLGDALLVTSAVSQGRIDPDLLSDVPGRAASVYRRCGKARRFRSQAQSVGRIARIPGSLAALTGRLILGAASSSPSPSSLTSSTPLLLSTQRAASISAKPVGGKRVARVEPGTVASTRRAMSGLVSTGAGRPAMDRNGILKRLASIRKQLSRSPPQNRRDALQQELERLQQDLKQFLD